MDVAVRKMGDFAAAQGHHDRALAIHRQALDRAHPDIAASLDNLGVVSAEQGACGAARDVFARP